MRPVFKTQSKAEAAEQQRRCFWHPTPPQQWRPLAVRLNAVARKIRATHRSLVVNQRNCD